MFRRRMSALALAGALALTQLGATAAEEARGTAATDLLGVGIDVDAGSLDVTGIIETASIDVLDVGTYASTDGTDRTSHAGPFAEAAVVPLRVGQEEIGAVRASTSDGTESGNSDGGTFGAVNEVTAAVGAQVAPFAVHASASADKAAARVDTLLADVAALLQTVDLDVEVTQLSSLVDQVNAATGAAVEVSSLDVTLGDLLPLEVLQTLPLSAILDLLEALPVDLSGVQDQIDALQNAISAVEAQLGVIEGAGAAVATAAAPFQQQVDALERLLADIQALDPVGDPAGTLLAVPDILLRAEALGVELPASCGSLDVLTVTDCVDDLEAAVLAEIDATLTLAASDGEGIADEVDALADAVADLEGLFNAVRLAAGELEAILSTILGLLEDAAGTELLAVDGFIVGLSALSTGNVDSSHAVVGCSPVTATVLGTSYTTPSCSDGLAAVQGVAAAVGGAIGEVESILASLPLGDVASVGDLKLELFGHLQESVVQDGDYVVATAGIELLELVIPSLTLDPTALTDLRLGDLALPELILDTVGTVIGEAEAVVEELFGDNPLGDTIDGVLAGAAALLQDGTGAVDAALDAALGALDELIAALGDIGTLTSFTTPSLSLVLDPTSTAEFATAAAAAPPAQDDDDPAMPATGGGAALIGLLGLAGAFTLIRRRD